jgi:hypothetical protein
LEKKVVELAEVLKRCQDEKKVSEEAADNSRKELEKLRKTHSGYQEAFLMNFSFFTMEFWLSGSLSHELFFFHDRILAIRKPFSRTFLFSRWNSGYQEAFLTNFLFHDGIVAIRKPFSRTFLFS